jgi:hypothetical protein
MSAKEKIIHHLHEARIAHIRWVNSIKLLVSGIDIPESDIELSPTDSLFGKWYYTEAQLFADTNARMVLEEIESLFLSAHDKYMKLYTIYYANKKKGMFSALLGSKKSITSVEAEFSQQRYEEIVLLSDKLKQKLRIFETQLMSMNDEKFEQIARFSERDAIPSPQEREQESENGAYYFGTRGRG